MGILDVLFDDDKKKKGQQDYGVLSYMNDEEDNNSEYTDEEIDSYGLEDWQKEEVKKGNYDPWSFEEEDLEDDDYYGEDDE